MRHVVKTKSMKEVDSEYLDKLRIESVGHILLSLHGQAEAQDSIRLLMTCNLKARSSSIDVLDHPLFAPTEVSFDAFLLEG